MVRPMIRRMVTVNWVLVSFLLVLAFGSDGVQAAKARFDFAKAEWEQVSNPKQDISVFRWKAPDRDLFAFKGEAVIDATVAKVVNVVTDIERQKEWLPDAGEIRLVEQLSPLHRVHYLHIKTPFVIKDRDFVIDGKASWHPEKQELHLEFASIEHPRVPRTDRVRGNIANGLYILKSIDGGRRTHATLQVYMDPSGTVPHWLVNATQRNYPKRMIEAIREQVKKNDIPEHPWARAALEGKITNESDLSQWMKEAPQANPQANTQGNPQS